MVDWFDTEMALDQAEAIAWDTCHKIYVLMDTDQVAQMREYGYADDEGAFFTKADKSPKEMLAIVKDWYEKSCFLRFVEAVETVAEGKDPNEGFTTLIEQGANDDEECDECDNDLDDCECEEEE